MKCFGPGLTFVVALLQAAALQSDIDRLRYDEGRKQFELVQQKSHMPRYGQCWRNAMMVIESGCRQLNDVVQTHLALSYLNCFLQIQGRSTYPCSEESDLETCVRDMSDGDRGSFATFFAHTQDICYFLQAQIWQENTENTISRLESTSSQVAEQLEFSHRVQQDMLSIQNLSLEKQEKLISHTQNLTDIINVSSMNVHSLFEDLKKSTLEQQHIIGVIADQLAKLQTTLFGEISGFYSLFYYVLAIFICYLLTATSRTSGARFWLFLIMTINVVLEQTVMRWISTSAYLFDEHDTGQEALYWLQRLCRRVCLLLALLVLAVCSYMYQDITAMNNRLLVEIRRQNSELCRLVTDGLKTFVWQKEDVTSSRRQEVAESTDSDYTSDNSGGDSGDDDGSDKTFILPENREDTDTDSFRTLQNDDVSDADQDSLMNELYDLRQLPLENSSRDVVSWLNGFCSQGGHIADFRDNEELERNTTPVLGGSPYNLRPRKSGPRLSSSPATQVESARSFSRTVHHMQQVAEKNSRLIRAIQEQSRLADNLGGSNCLTPSGSRLLNGAVAAQPDYTADADTGSDFSRSSRASSRRQQNGSARSNTQYKQQC